MSAGTEG